MSRARLAVNEHGNGSGQRGKSASMLNICLAIDYAYHSIRGH